MHFSTISYRYLKAGVIYQVEIDAPASGHTQDIYETVFKHLVNFESESIMVAMLVEEGGISYLINKRFDPDIKTTQVISTIETLEICIDYQTWVEVVLIPLT
ncbi:hypothetical protein IQ22_01518 [Pseudomonas duriflava]|uniref:Uncharacterized protein n=1 Tax=Pseudomonas duriflava TaxID=459528 RepID=A0A562QFQ7_9PSED|nr:hypothetical protein [Pseudomonas duriflava]TWI55592.1 hypothetical protein IQ22_01518 [Pseudomonas duriflava]